MMFCNETFITLFTFKRPVSSMSHHMPEKISFKFRSVGTIVACKYRTTFLRFLCMFNSSFKGSEDACKR